MSAVVRILSTKGLDSSPTILMVSPGGDKTIINCGEGCQRIFLEFSQKMATVSRVCLTHLSHESIGGLPGMILTTADISSTTIADAKVAAKGAGNMPTKQPGAHEPGPLPGLDIIGPKGTQQFVQSLRHFMRRDSYQVRVHEGTYVNTGNKKSKKRKRNEEVKEYFSIETVACVDNQDSHNQAGATNETGEKTLLSYIFTSPPILGKFLADKAKELGIPPGPLYGQLKSGKSVTFLDKDGKEQSVESHQVVEAGSPGISTAVLYYPSENVLEQLIKSLAMHELKERTGPKDPILELIVHIAPPDIFKSYACNEWRKSFGDDVEHLYVETGSFSSQPDENARKCLTPFFSASAGSFARSQVSSKIYESLPPMTAYEIDSQGANVDGELVGYTVARPLLEYVIVPRPKRGFQKHSAFNNAWMKIKGEAHELVRRTEADICAKCIISELEPQPHNDNQKRGELIFTGTGSAIPCKYRNVSGICLRMENGNSMLLDVGEGTIGQLLRIRHSESSRDLVVGIKAVWISHPHADHHLGIIRLLEDRANLTDDRLTLIAPTNLFYFLRDYEDVDSSINGSYNFINCRDLTTESTKSDDLVGKLKKLEVDLGVKSCVSVPVAHCPNSFAVILNGTPFGSVAYSGDCRPSRRFAAAALNVDLLIHEATFADGMEAEANVKRHCTVGEALTVARDMKAKNVVLTHFSQRYPKIPPLSTDEAESLIPFPVIFAFDYMKVSPSTLIAASKITPAMRLLYPDEPSKSMDDEDSVAMDALQTPGLFAQSSLL